MTHPRYPHLLEPLTLGTGPDALTLRNRVVMGSMHTGLEDHPWDIDKLAAFFEERARGGVGLIMCQWARHLGVTVIGVVSTEAKAELARAHGAAHTVIGHAGLVEEVRRITGGAMVPVVYDSVGADTFTASLDCLRPRGMMVSFGKASGPVPPFDIGVLAAKGSLFLTRPSLAAYTGKRDELVRAAEDLFSVVGSGAVQIKVNQTFPLADAAAAHVALEARRTTGSTVLLP